MLGKSSSVRIRKSPFIFLFLVALLAFLISAGTALAQEPSPAQPHINNIYPSRGPVGTPVMITGTNFGLQTSLSTVTFNGIKATPIAWYDTVILTRVPEGATTGPVVVTVLGVFKSNEVMFEVTGTSPTPPPPGPVPRYTWYLAEGSTAHGFETYVLIQNPGDVNANVAVVYNTQQYGQMTRPSTLTVPAGSRVTLYLNEEVPNVDVSTFITSTQPVVCERAMYWNERIEGHESLGVTSPSTRWYFAEGSTNHGFETWILLQNPATAAANVKITYMTDTGVVEKEPFRLGGGQRASIPAVKDIGAKDFSTEIESDQPIVCERAMYWDGRRGGHCSNGVTSGSKRWYLAEGTTAWGFETWLLIQNPGDTDAGVNVVYQTSSGPSAEKPLVLPPKSRKTIFVNESVKGMDTSIKVTSNREIIVERSMYWDNGTGKAGHGTVGSPTVSRNIFFAEGSTAWGFETYICVQNPQNKPVSVTVIYMLPGGPRGGPEFIIPALSRITIYLNEVLPNEDVAVKLLAESPVMAERAMYWHERGGGHCSIGFIENEGTVTSSAPE